MAMSKAMLALLRALSYPDLEVKKNYESMRAVITATSPRTPRVRYRAWDHRVECGDHEVPVRVFTPIGGLGSPVLLFFHGGGWVTGNIDSYDHVCANMTRATGRVVISVDYRLAPEYKFPAAPEDCYAVTQEVLRHAETFGVDASEVTLIGDSAGGNLAAAVSLMARDRGGLVPRRQILVYPAVYNDHHPDTSPFSSVRENGTEYLLTSKRICDYMDLYVSGDEDRQSPYFAPLLCEDLSRQPDTLVITAEFDPLRDEGEAYGERLREAGADVEIHRIPDTLHGFLSLPLRFSPVRHAYRIIDRFLSRTGRNNGFTTSGPTFGAGQSPHRRL